MIVNRTWCFLKPDSELAEKAIPKPIDFKITPETLTNFKDVFIILQWIKNLLIEITNLKYDKQKSKIPNFVITGQLESSVCCIQKPLNGHVSWIK